MSGTSPPANPSWRVRVATDKVDGRRLGFPAFDWSLSTAARDVNPCPRSRAPCPGQGGDSIVKLRPVVPADLPANIRLSGSFRVEVDALPGGYVCSGTMKGTPSLDEVRAAAAGERPLRTLFTKEQRAFFAAHVKDGITLDDLTVLGPIFVLKLRLMPDELPRRRVVVEMWIYPDGSHVLELSTRCATGEAFQVAAELRAFLHGRGIDISGEQETRTRKALEYFAGTLK